MSITAIPLDAIGRRWVAGVEHRQCRPGDGRDIGKPQRRTGRDVIDLVAANVDRSVPR
jgi:hypothetical protein